MRRGVALAIWTLAACGASEAPSMGPVTDVAVDMADASDGAAADLVTVDLSASDAFEDEPDTRRMTTDAEPSDAPSIDGNEEPDGLPFSDVVSHLLLTDSAGESVYLDASHAGYEAYVFGAEVYGDLLKLWASEGDTKLEFLIRLDQNELPGSFSPGPPGEGAWALLMLGEENAYVTQTTSGTIQIDVCPQTEGQLLTGHFDGIPMYSMSGLSTANFKVSGTFELLLGSVDGATYCAP
jgi:hypothetical protein